MTAGPPMQDYWQGKRVLVTGGAGFIGGCVVAALRRRGVADADIVVPRSASCDLRLLQNCRQAVRGCSIVIHLAAPTGGIAFSRAHPASQFRDCMLINLHLLEAAREAAVDKFVALGNLLAYPAAAPAPLREDTVHDGAVAATHMGIGQAKRDMLSLAEMYRVEYGLNVVNVLAANAYGPRDHFEGATAHVIPATIVKCFRDEDLVVWGDGSPTRDFLFVEDVADGLLLAGERLSPPGFVNLASGTEISIAELVKLIARLCGFKRRIVFDTSKGGGDPRRVASTSRSDELLAFAPRVPIDEGLRRTIEWFTRTIGGAATR
jgi:GDP-L-fucose synthase